MTKLTPRAEYLEQQLRAKLWHDFLSRIGYYQPHLPFTISITIPPTYIRTNNDCWEYLRQIAAGHVNIRRCGPLCQAKLTQFLRENDPENQ